MSDEADAHRVLRPSIPTLAYGVAGVWAGTVVAQRANWAIYATGSRSAATGCVVLVACGVVVALAARRRLPVAAVGAAAICAGVIGGWAVWTEWRTDVGALDARASTRVCVEVLADEVESPFGVSSSCRFTEGPARGAVVTVRWPQGTQAPALGRQVELFGSFKPPSADEFGRRSCSGLNVGSLAARLARDQGWARSVRGVIGPIRLWAVQRLSAERGDGGALLAGVLLGDRRRLAGTGADTDFRTTGLTHLVAVSGSHLVVVATVVGFLATALGMGRTGRLITVAIVVGAYVVFSGVQPSAVRAWVMAVAASFASLAGRRVDGGSTLCVAALGVLLASPAAAFDLGFQLSVAAVAGLVVFTRFAEAWLSGATAGRFRSVVSAVALTLTATAATIPLTVSTFGMLSLVSPLANVVAGPLISAALVCGIAGLALSAVWAPLGFAAMWAARAAASLSAIAAHWMAGLRYAAIPLGVSAPLAASACSLGAAMLWAWWPRPTRLRAQVVLCVGCGLVAALALGPPPPGGSRIVVLDVGQGDAILVRDGGDAVLIDAGPADGAMRAALARFGVRELDAVVLTHLHADHYGGLGALKGTVRVGEVLLPTGSKASANPAIDEARKLVGDAGVAEISAGATLRVGALRLEALWPRGTVDDPATNEASVVLRADEGPFAAVLTGDAEEEVLRPLVADGQLGDIDVLKIGHHGSEGAVSEAELAVLRPEYALISVGAGNKFGHPTRSTLRVLLGSGSRVVRTDECGDITVTIGRDGVYSVRVSGSVPGDHAASRGRTAPPRGLSHVGYATLMANPRAHSCRTRATESHGQAALRVQARLPHLRGARSPPGARAGTAQAQRGGGRRPRLQLRDIRRRVGRRGRDRGGMQHPAIRV